MPRMACPGSVDRLSRCHGVRLRQRGAATHNESLSVGGRLAYSTGTVDLFAAVTKYVWGRDTHNGIAYTVGSTWYFSFARPTP